MTERYIFPKVNLLGSYFFLRNARLMEQLLIALAPYCNILLDSGAYSNMTATRKALKTGGKYNPITIEEYAHACIERYHKRIWGYITLDVIGEAGPTWDNYVQLLDAGLTPIPVVQPRESRDRLLEYVKNSRRIAVGGIAGNTVTSKPYAHYSFQRLYRESEGKARLHALGFLDWPYIFQLPLRYGDSSTYMAGARFGRIQLFDQYHGFSNIQYHQLGKYMHTRPGSRTLGNLIKFGFDPGEHFDKKYYRGHDSIPALVSTYGYLQFHDFCATKKDFAYFFVVANFTHLTAIFATLAATFEGGFNYPEARRYYHYLKELWAANREDAIMEVIRITREFTHWQQVLE